MAAPAETSFAPTISTSRASAAGSSRVSAGSASPMRAVSSFVIQLASERASPFALAASADS